MRFGCVFIVMLSTAQTKTTLILSGEYLASVLSAWARLFEINDVISFNALLKSDAYRTKELTFFCWRIERILCIRFSHFSYKKCCIFDNVAVIYMYLKRVDVLTTSSL